MTHTPAATQTATLHTGANKYINSYTIDAEKPLSTTWVSRCDGFMHFCNSAKSECVTWKNQECVCQVPQRFPPQSNLKCRIWIPVWLPPTYNYLQSQSPLPLPPPYTALVRLHQSQLLTEHVITDCGESEFAGGVKSSVPLFSHSRRESHTPLQTCNNFNS